MLLIERAAPGDREKAKTLLNQALATYMQIGRPCHIEMTPALLASAADRRE
jgi:hypothetical protein